MKILMVDKYFFIKGGAERYYFELKGLLEKHGHEVIPFSMRHPENFPTAWERYFVDNIEFNGLRGLRKLGMAPKIAGRVLYSTAAKQALEKLIAAAKPDLAHLHMIDHQISPSILHVLQKHDIPVLQTCHQYKLVCPSYRLLVMRENRLCEKCVTGHFYHAIAERCHKDSVAASALVAFESYLHKWMGLYDLIDLFHVPSHFLGNMLRRGGISSDRIWQQFYTINLDDYPFSAEQDDYIVYYGRLSEEKGILTLLRAVQQVEACKLLIIGDGPQRPQLEAFAQNGKMEHVFFTGNKSGHELKALVSRARLVVVPSEWYDNSPLVIYESFSMGKPVIATNLGGMPELIEPGVTGFLCEPKDVEGLAVQIRLALQSNGRLREMGRAARAKAEREFAPEKHYQKIMSVYQKMIGVDRSLNDRTR